jgi:CRP-like cAMP-binding protein
MAAPPDFLANRLLAALPDEEYAQLRPHLGRVELAAGRTIYEPGETPRDVYFPLTGIASVVVSMADGALVEAGTSGGRGWSAWPRSSAPTAAR